MKCQVRSLAMFALLVSGTAFPCGVRAQDTAAVNDLSRAILLTELGRIDQAIEVLQRVVAADSSNGVAFEDLGAAYAIAGQVPDAMAAWWKALVVNPKLVTPHTNLGNAFMDLLELDSAIAEHRRVIQLDSTNATGYVDLGAALERQGLNEEAGAQFRRAVTLDPQSAIAWFNVGYSSYSLRRWPEAYAALLTAFYLDPWYPDIQGLMSQISQVASSDLEQQANQKPRDAIAHYYLAYAREFRGDRGAAMKEIDRALALDPSNPGFYDAKAAFYWARGKPKQAVQVLRDCVAAVPSSWVCYGSLGGDYNRLGEKQEALDALTAAASAVQFTLGLAYAALGQNQQAAVVYEKALALGATAAEVHYNLAAAYSGLARYDLAWRHARIAERRGCPCADFIDKLAQLAPEPNW